MKPTDADIEIAKRAVSLTLWLEEAAWGSVSELISEHVDSLQKQVEDKALAINRLVKRNEQLYRELRKYAVPGYKLPDEKPIAS